MEKDAVNKAWNEIAKKFEFLENSKVISSNLYTPNSQNTSEFS